MADQAPSAGTTNPELLDDPAIKAKAAAAGQQPADYLRDHPEEAVKSKTPDQEALQSWKDVGSGLASGGGSLAGAVKSGGQALAKASTDPIPGTARSTPLATIPKDQATPPASFDAAYPGAGEPGSTKAGPPASAAGPGPEQAGAPGHVPHAPEVGAANPAPGPVQTTPPETPAKPETSSTPSTVKQAVSGAAAPAGGTPPPAVENPKELKGAIAAFKAEPGASEYKTELGRLADLQKAYQDAYKAQLDKNEAKEIGERFGNALAQLGAGIQGQRTGYDTTTGLKFDKTDWAKRNEQALGELKAGLENLASQQGTAGRLESEARTQTGETARQATGIQAASTARGQEIGAKATAAGLEQGAAQKRTETEVAGHIKGQEILAGSREAAAGTRADSAKTVAQIKADTSLSVADKRAAASLAVNGSRDALRKAGQQDRVDQATRTALGQTSAAIGLLAQGKEKEANALLDKPGVRGLAMQAIGAERFNQALKDGRDAAGLFSSGDVTGTQQSLLQGGGQPAPAPAALPAGAKVHMKDPKTGQEADVNPEAVEKYLKMGMQRVGG